MGPPGDDRTQVVPMLVTWTLLSGYSVTHIALLCINTSHRNVNGNDDGRNSFNEVFLSFKLKSFGSFYPYLIQMMYRDKYLQITTVVAGENWDLTRSLFFGATYPSWNGFRVSSLKVNVAGVIGEKNYAYSSSQKTRKPLTKIIHSVTMS